MAVDKIGGGNSIPQRLNRLAEKMKASGPQAGGSQNSGDNKNAEEASGAAGASGAGPAATCQFSHEVQQDQKVNQAGGAHKAQGGSQVGSTAAGGSREVGGPPGAMAAGGKLEDGEGTPGAMAAGGKFQSSEGGAAQGGGRPQIDEHVKAIEEALGAKAA